MPQASEATGAVHMLVNNASQAASAPFARTRSELWQQMLDVNVTGTFLVTRAAVINGQSISVAGGEVM